MSGVTIVGALLQAHEPLTSAVAQGNIKAGRLTDTTALPTLLLRSVSRVERLMLKRVGTVRITERIAVTARAESYREPGLLLRLVRDACAHKTGTIAGFERCAVLTAGTGPDVLGPGDSFERTQDFSVTFEETV